MIFFILNVLLFAVSFRCLLLILYNKSLKREKLLNTKNATCSTLIVLGSGGHTAEMFSMLKTLDKEKFVPRNYVLADNDTISLNKLRIFEADNSDNAYDAKLKKYNHFKIPRSRNVGQNFFTTIFTTLYATSKTVFLIHKLSPDVIITNGPGTCIPVCISAIMLNVFLLRNINIVFVESFARVNDLSLSGKMVYYFTDLFIVQWPNLVKKYPKAVYLGKRIV
ncbi:UDP-N-acetylglucosamine transferase subunit [Lobulomyces angularis]|nr:UDP-N-acetylglucosamine transferase subunit [Lobulomyces angularis]